MNPLIPIIVLVIFSVNSEKVIQKKETGHMCIRTQETTAKYRPDKNNIYDEFGPTGIGDGSLTRGGSGGYISAEEALN